MHQLNHKHIFHISLAPNDVNLDAITEGLQSVVDALKSDTQYVAEVERLGGLYLAQGRAFLHGDYFPGS